MNKGIAKANGDIVGILNADDFYSNNTVLQKVMDAFVNNQEIDVVYADLEYVNAQNTNKVVRYWKSRAYKKGLFKKGWHPAHPTLFVKKTVYNTCGVFDEEFKIASDYEFMLRIFEKYKVMSYYIPDILVKMRAGGESNASIKNIYKANKESYGALRKNGFGFLASLITVLRKPFSKIIQLFKRA